MIVIPIVILAFIIGFIFGALIALDYSQQYYHLLRGEDEDSDPKEKVALDIDTVDKDSSNNTVALDSNSMEQLMNSGGGDYIPLRIVDRKCVREPSQYRVVRVDDGVIVHKL